MRWTSQRSSNSRGSLRTPGSAGSVSPRRAQTPDGAMMGGATSLPGPASGWFLPVSPKSEDNSPGRGLESRSSFVREQELQGMRPVLVQASEPSVAGRKGRQSPRHGASVRYVASPREQQGRDPSRSHLAGRGVGEVLRYKVLDQVIEVIADGSIPESTLLPSANGTAISAIQQHRVAPSAVGSVASRLGDAVQKDIAAGGISFGSGYGYGRAKTPAAAKRRQMRQHLGQRPPPAGPHHAPGAVILDDFRISSRRPVMVQLAQRKRK